MSKFAKIILENNENLLIKKLIRLFKAKIKQSGSKRFSFVLTGGASPINLYKNLSKDKKIPWKKIDFFISDERFVDKNSKNSNIKMCKKYLLDKIKISKNQIYEISTDKISIKKSVFDYEDKIKKYFLRKKVCFNLTLLGMGKDGHIASLFKNNINKKTKNNVVSVKKKYFSRISLSLKCINNSKIIFLWIPGRSKSNIIKQILKDKKFKYPVSFLKRKNTFLFHSN
tara:strand:+ start:89 stop:769 length:681 start_codon:yes stop_codon:yes gene_type:complete